MTQFPQYPQLDTELSGYAVVVRYEGCDPIQFPGAHDAFDAAKHRAIRIRKNLFAAGETGLSAWIVVRGERVPGFPRNGVRA
jgi:hypothetical protein